MRFAIRLIQRIIAAAELLLLAPAAVFMTAAALRRFGPIETDPAHTAQRVVAWYAERPWTLWTLLIALPLVVCAIGVATLQYDWARKAMRVGGERRWPEPSHLTFALLIVAMTTLAAGGVLAIVAVHMLAT